jgi:hypothetical protein
MTDVVADAARSWPQDQADGASQPSGARLADPFVICGEMSDALPDDARAVTLATSWCEEYLAALRELD